MLRNARRAGQRPLRLCGELLQSIFLSDYIDLLKDSGWEITHIVDCPLSTQRFLPNMVSHMQKNRTLEIVRRSLIIGRKK